MRKILTFLTTIIMLTLCSSSFALLYTSKITGISGEQLENSQKRIELNQQSIHGPLTEAHVKRLYHEGLDGIKQSLRPFGYFKAEVKGQLEWYQKGGWHATYHVTLGPRIYINKVSIQITGEARNDPEFIKLRASIKIKPGQPLNTDEYQKVKQQLLELASARGYFDATLVQSQVAIKMKTNQADIKIQLSSGNRYRFGKVRFSRISDPTTRLSDSFLCRYIPFKMGDPFTMEELLKLQNQLASSHYFKSVSVAPETTKTQDRLVPIHVVLTPMKGQKYTFGVGFGTDTGVRGSAGVKFRRLNECGHYFSGQTKFAYKTNDLRGYIKGSYNIPGANPATDLYSFGAGLSQDDTEHIGLGQTINFNANYLTEVYSWQQTASLSLRLERSDPSQERTFSSTLLMPSIQWFKVESDDPLKPNNGYRIQFDAHGANESLFSTVNFIQAELNVKYIKQLSDYHRLILRGDLGGVAIKDIDDLPVSLRFAAGGSQSVRGYGYHNIGPGRALVVGSIELQQQLYKDLYLTGFYDIGNASSSYQKNYNQGVGLGLLWRSPIGAINLTIAQAIDKPGKPYLLEFHMGPEL